MNRPKFIDCFPKYTHRDKNQMDIQLVAYMNYCDRLEQYCDELEAISKTGKSKEMSIDGKPLYTKEEAFDNLYNELNEDGTLNGFLARSSLDSLMMHIDILEKNINQLDKALDKALATYSPKHCGECNIKKRCLLKNKKISSVLCAATRKEWCLENE